jgi:DNA-binding transcriptional ArsR family regulator
VDAFAALADPIRRQILELLVEGELDAGAIAERFAVSRPAVSRHLRVLRDADMVAARVEAQRRVYQLRPERFAEIDDWLSRYRTFWTNRLDALELELRRNAAKGD